MRQIFSLVTLLFFLSACLNQGAKRMEQAAQEKAEKDSILIIEKPFPNNPSKIEYIIPVLKETNLRHGIQKRFYPHGSLYSEVPYILNERNGMAYTYYKAYKGAKPAVWKEQPYVNGKLNGICKRYYENGKLQSEYEYKDGMPAIGLKEYNESGEEIKQPVLTVKCAPTERYHYVTAQLSKKAGKVTYYTGDLVDGKYFPGNLREIQDRDGIAEVLIPKEATKVTIVAVFYTRLSNECILAKTILLK